MPSDTQALTGRSGPGFYVVMALLMAALVVVGFGPTFYLKPVVASRPLSPLVTLHGVLFTGWIALLVTQTWLIAKGRSATHMRLGRAGVVLAIAMLVVGLMTGTEAARLGHGPPGAPPPLMFLAVPFFSIMEFAILFACAVAMALRGNTEAHKRLMLLATVAMLGAAVARLKLPFASVPPGVFVVADFFILAGVIRDWRVEGVVHPAYIWGGIQLVLVQVLQLALMGTPAWIGFAGWLVATL